MAGLADWVVFFADRLATAVFLAASGVLRAIFLTDRLAFLAAVLAAGLEVLTALFGALLAFLDVLADTALGRRFALGATRFAVFVVAETRDLVVRAVFLGRPLVVLADFFAVPCVRGVFFVPAILFALWPVFLTAERDVVVDFLTAALVGRLDLRAAVFFETDFFLLAGICLTRYFRNLSVLQVFIRSQSNIKFTCILNGQKSEHMISKRFT
ncbi:MAG: hypothetical protein QNJ26_10840 [Desulfobacterales bacterium]|nr:hypothetical protein [Desulfobacterales bacterium]